MKCVGIQHIEAVRRLKEQGKKFKRTIHLVFVPEEEVCLLYLLSFLALSTALKGWWPGWDEAVCAHTRVQGHECRVWSGRRHCWAGGSDATLLRRTQCVLDQSEIELIQQSSTALQVTCPGSPGHGSMFLENTAGEKAQYMINKLLAYRYKCSSSILGV